MAMYHFDAKLYHAVVGGLAPTKGPVANAHLAQTQQRVIMAALFVRITRRLHLVRIITARDFAPSNGRPIQNVVYLEFIDSLSFSKQPQHTTD